MDSKTDSRLESGQELEALFRKRGYRDFKWLDPKKIVVSQWVRMKCMFGCPEYGRGGCCPPQTPSVAECERFFREYSRAVVFRFEKKVDQPEDRHAWTRKVNAKLSKLEREVFVSGYERAFLLFMDTCHSCGECTGERVKCQAPRVARPAPEALAVDVYSTVRQLGYPVQVLADYSEAMNRYAFLLVD